MVLDELGVPARIVRFAELLAGNGVLANGAVVRLGHADHCMYIGLDRSELEEV